MVRVRPTVPVIHHEGICYVDVTVDVGGRDVGAVSDDIRAGLDRMDFPLEYHAELLGDYGDEQRAQGRLLTFAIAAAIGIFLLLQAAFGSWRTAIISFVMLPASLAEAAPSPHGSTKAR